MFEWSVAQARMRDDLRRFVAEEIEPWRDSFERDGVPPYDVLRKMYVRFGIGDAALERYRRSADGERRPRDPDELACVLLPLIELSRCSPGMVTALGVSVNLASAAILRAGSRAQAERWVPDLLTLRTIGTWALTEPGSGPDTFGTMRSTAKPDGDEFVLNGAKTFITNGPYADTIVFVCKIAGPQEENGHTRIGSFVLDRGMPGLEQTPPLRKMGMHSSPTGQLFLTDVRAGRDRLLSGRRAGCVRGTFVAERASIAAMALGIIERCIELSVEHARTRAPIRDFPMVQGKLARMEVARLTVQSLVFRYIEQISSGHAITLGEASAMKLHSARSALDVAVDAMRVHGDGPGDGRIEQLARDAQVLQIYAGTDELQTLAIADQLLTAR